MPDINANGLPAPAAPEVLPGIPDHAFNWLKDEHALRDEGAFYGLVEGDTREKENAIRQYFEMFIQSLRKGIGIDGSAVAQLEQEIDELENSKRLKQAEQAEWRKPAITQPHYFYRHILGVAAYTLMLLFNFGLIYEILEGSTRYPLWLSLGVYLFGMLSLVRRVAIVYASEQDGASVNFVISNHWKMYAEEFGIPAVCALFVVIYGQTTSAPHAAIVFILVFALFMYAGKGFWQSWVNIQEEYLILWNNRITRRNRLARLDLLQKEILEADTKIENKRQELKGLANQVRELNMQLARTEAHMVATISYFKSEYDLARSSKRLGIFG